MRDLMLTGDIAELLGVSRQYVQRLVQRKDFPRPFGTSPNGTRVWLASDVRRWAKHRDR